MPGLFDLIWYSPNVSIFQKMTKLHPLWWNKMPLWINSMFPLFTHLDYSVTWLSRTLQWHTDVQVYGRLFDFESFRSMPRSCREGSYGNAPLFLLSQWENSSRLVFVWNLNLEVEVFDFIFLRSLCIIFGTPLFLGPRGWTKALFLQCPFNY